MTERSYVWFILLFFKFILLNCTRIGLYRVSQNWGKRRVIFHFMIMVMKHIAFHYILLKTFIFLRIFFTLSIICNNLGKPILSNVSQLKSSKPLRRSSSVTTQRKKVNWFALREVSKSGVFSGPNTGRYGPKKNSYFDAFHVVLMAIPGLQSTDRHWQTGWKSPNVFIFFISFLFTHNISINFTSKILSYLPILPQKRSIFCGTER